MKKTKRFALLILPFALLGLMTLLTDPYELPLAALLLPFILIGWGVYSLTREILRLSPLSARKVRFISGSSTAIILLTAVLQSIGQLSVRDFMIMLALLVGVALYVRRIDI